MVLILASSFTKAYGMVSGTFGCEERTSQLAGPLVGSAEHAPRDKVAASNMLIGHFRGTIIPPPSPACV